MNAKSPKKRSKTDWKRINAQSDADIDTSDIPALKPDFFESAEDIRDLAIFKKRANEPSIAFEDVVKDLKRRGKI